MQSVAQAWLVLQLTDSPFRLGLIGTLQFAPILLFSVIAGALADRLPKRRVILATQAVLSLQALTLAALVGTGHVQYWHVGVLALVYGLANVLDMPARQAFIVEMVGKADLVNAVALNSAAFNGARIVGPAVAGLLIARFGVAPAFLLNGLSFVIVIAALLAVRARGLPRPRRVATLGAEMLEGVRYATRTPRVAVILSLVCVVSLCVFNFTIFVPLLARSVLRLGAEGFGFLMAAVGAGAVSGALALAGLGGRQSSLRAIFTAGTLACAATLALAMVADFRAAVVLLFVLGFFAIVFIASCNTTLQLTAPDALRGRVMSLHALMFGGVFPIGSFLVGTIAEAFGIRAALAAAGAAGLLGVALVGVRWRTRARPAGEVVTR